MNQLSAINPGAEIVQPTNYIPQDGASNVQVDINIPQQIGKYKITKKVGAGAFSQVFAVIDTVTGEQKICVKIISKSTVHSQVDVVQLAREIKTLSSISHENVIKFIDFGEDEFNYYIFQELSDGASLLKFVTAAAKPLSESLSRIIFKQLINVLIFLHSNGIYHRDIKLENILINTDKTIKLIDFGFCAFESGDSLLKTICGSLRYLAPECIKGEAYSGALADVWSAGVVLFVMVTNIMPFNGSSQPQIIKNIIEGNYEIPDFVSLKCADLIKRIFVLDPNQRITAEQISSHPWMAEDIPQPINVYSDLMHRPSLPAITDRFKLSKLESSRRRSFSTKDDVCERRNTTRAPAQASNYSRIPKMPRRVNQTFVTHD